MNEYTTRMESVGTSEVHGQVKVPTVKAVAMEAESVAVPDAVKQADTSLAARDQLALVRARGVEWVRAADLITRGSGRVAGAGIRLHQAVGTQTRRGITSGVRAVSRRARELPPVSAFGRRGTSSMAEARSGVGMR